MTISRWWNWELVDWEIGGLADYGGRPGQRADAFASALVLPNSSSSLRPRVSDAVRHGNVRVSYLRTPTRAAAIRALVTAAAPNHDRPAHAARRRIFLVLDGRG